MVRQREAIAYTRVSTDGQANGGMGLQLQRKTVEAYAQAAGYKVVEIFSDTHSAVGSQSIENRQGMRSAMKLAQAKKIPVIVDELSRISRNTKNLEVFMERSGIKILSARGGGRNERAVIIATVRRAQAEAERISETTRVGLVRARERGVRLGNQTNLGEAQKKGASVNRGKAAQQAEQLAPVIAQLKAGGRLTKSAIADGLNLLGYCARGGGPWTAVTIRRVLDRVAEMERLESVRRAVESNPNFGRF